jgi:hypothetical protein
LTEIQLIAKAGESRCWKSVEKTVNHDVADKYYLVFRFTLATKLFASLSGRSEQEIRESISDDPVDLLGHLMIKAPQPSLNMRDGDAHLRGHYGSSHGRIHIPVNDDPTWALSSKHWLQALHNPSCLHSV